MVCFLLNVTHAKGYVLALTYRHQPCCSLQWEVALLRKELKEQLLFTVKTG